MAARKRTLAAFAAGALLVPLSPFASPAFADHVDERDIDIACPENAVSENNYEDVPDANLFERQINCLTDYGVATGRSATDYDPELDVSRRQMAQFIYRIGQDAGFTFDTTTDPGYSDDTALEGEARDAIWGLTNAGIVQGVGGNRFEPNGGIRRDQMATFIAEASRTYGFEGFETTEDFFRDDELSVHEENINDIASEGVTIGVGGSSEFNYGPLPTVIRQQMAGFLARVIDIGVEQGDIESVFDTTPVTVTVNEQGQDVNAGDPITGTISGSNVDSASVAGDCVDSGTVTDTDGDATNGIQFSINTDEAAAGGNCNLTFTVTFTNGRTEDFDANVNIIPAPVGTNVRPELVEAAIVSTTTTGQVTPGNPAGTVVSYAFDETVLETGAPPTAGEFMVYETDTAGGAGNTADAIVDVDDNVVTVRFDDITTTEGAAALTMATVDIGAVRDVDGDENPEGDAELGSTSGGGSTTQPAGTTTAPDLVSVSGFRQGAGVGETAVDFTFDQPAFVNNSGGFSLIELNGANGAANDNEERGTGPAPTDTSTGANAEPSGGTVEGGNGTTTITVIFNQGGSDAVLTAADIARATIAPDTVSDAQDATPTDPATTNGNTNPLQAVDVSNGGNTGTEPDLVSVQIQPSTTGGTDQALFTFDQPVDTADETLFALYDINSVERFGSTTATNNSNINPNNRTQVLVDFTGGTEDTVGGSVRENAVTVAASPTNATADNNEQDEVGFENQTGPAAGQTAGRTDSPDLTGVQLATGPSDAFGNPGDFQATYTFDEDVVEIAAANSNFRLFLADGSQLNATACTVGGTEETDATVTCTDFTNTEPATDRAATSDEIGSAVLGTVDNGAVNDQQTGTTTAGTETNPEGAEPTTGGTGQAQQ